MSIILHYIRWHLLNCTYYIDRELNFNCHVTEVCRKAGRQLNALRRLANVFDMKDFCHILTSVQQYETFVLSQI